MQTLHVVQLHRRYHLRESERDLQAALDDTLFDLLDEHLPAALQQLGVGDDEQLCIRTLQLPLRWRSRNTVYDNSLQWSRQLRTLIEREMAAGGDNVVRYASRRAALLDMASAIAVNDTRRAWAWRQLGLASLPDACTVAQAAPQLLSALRHEAALIVPTLLQLAARRRLLPVLRQFDRYQIDTLWQAWMQHCRIDPRWIDVGATLSATRATVESIDLDHSVVLRELCDAIARGHLPLPSRHASVLIATECVPSIFLQPPAQVAAALAQIERQLGVVSMPDAGAHASTTAARRHDAIARDTQAGREPAKTQAAQARRAMAPDVSPEDIDGAPDIRPVQDKLQRAAESVAPADDDRAAPDATYAGDAGALQARDGDITSHALLSDYGGLFLLLPVLARRDLVRALLEDNCFGERPLVWRLCALCQCLLPVPLPDVALKLFCGIAPDAEWPLRGAAAQPTPSEGAALKAYADEITQTLADLLRWPQGAGAFIRRLCRRHARLLDDAGWLEVVFALRDVDTEVRRAGLDLDPDYVPWLGKVVKFRYE